MKQRLTHTPGPWEYDPDGDFHNDRDGVRYVDLSAGSAPEGNSRFARIDPGPTSKADARLIAAATDLLAACKAALDGLSSIEEQYESDTVEYRICHRAAEKVRAAIAKAEGE